MGRLEPPPRFGGIGGGRAPAAPTPGPVGGGGALILMDLVGI